MGWLVVGAFVIAGVPLVCMWYADRELERIAKRLKEDAEMLLEMEGED